MRGRFQAIARQVIVKLAPRCSRRAQPNPCLFQNRRIRVMRKQKLLHRQRVIVATSSNISNVKAMLERLYTDKRETVVIGELPPASDPFPRFAKTPRFVSQFYPSRALRSDLEYEAARRACTLLHMHTQCRKRLRAGSLLWMPPFETTNWPDVPVETLMLTKCWAANHSARGNARQVSKTAS